MDVNESGTKGPTRIIAYKCDESEHLPTFSSFCKITIVMLGKEWNEEIITVESDSHDCPFPKFILFPISVISRNLKVYI